MLIDSIKNYLNSKIKTPFFMFIGDDQYTTTVGELRVYGLDIIKLSQFCCYDDKIPDIDKFISKIILNDKNKIDKKFVVTGLGEYLALRGAQEATFTLSRLKDLNIGRAKVILLLRGLSPLSEGLKTDPRFDNRRYSVSDKIDCDISLTLAAPSVRLPALTGFKAMLAELENGRSGNIDVNTAVNLDKAMFTVRKIDNAYDGMKSFISGLILDRSWGTDARWAELLAEISCTSNSLDLVFEKHELSDNLESNFYTRISGNDYQHWLYFIYLKSKVETLKNSYLRFVLDKTEQIEDFANNILNLIIEINPNDSQFEIFYRERKALVEKFPESDIASFVVNNRRIVPESIYRLTDGTRAEREEIIAWLANNGLIAKLENIYPTLALYLKKYVFKCPELAELLTEYFEAYKRQKLLNKLEPDFLEKVDDLALSRQFNRLPSKDETIDRLNNSETYLYWFDALGVEYLSLIEALAQKKGLSVKINIARAELPTITSINKGFFDSWLGPKEKNGELDDVKHTSNGGYNFTNNRLPIHLAKELDIITSMMDKVATELTLRSCKKALIVSDHGASRLAVLRQKEEKYDTDTSGEHSGRCCKLFQPYNLPFAAEGNGYLVLADYGRFRGSRAANVEVHGGASLEEVVVPIIELSLIKNRVTVKLVDESATVDFRAGTEINLFFNSIVKDVFIILNNKRYHAVQADENHYNVKLPDIKRAGNYPADVYAGDNLIGKITIKAQGKSGKINDDFDDLF